MDASPPPVVLFFPARNEARTVGDVVARTPAEVRGHPVHFVVVDDGSHDDDRGASPQAPVPTWSPSRHAAWRPAVRTGLAGGRRPRRRPRSRSATPTASTRPRSSSGWSRRSSPAPPTTSSGRASPGPSIGCVRNAGSATGCSRRRAALARRRDHRWPERYRALSPAAARRRDRARLQLRAGADARPRAQGLPLRRGADLVPLPPRGPFVRAAAALPPQRRTGSVARATVAV